MRRDLHTINKTEKRDVWSSVLYGCHYIAYCPWPSDLSEDGPVFNVGASCHVHWTPPIPTQCTSSTESLSPLWVLWGKIQWYSLDIHGFIALLTPSAAAAAKSLQSCPTLCNPIDGSPPGSPIPGILQARTLAKDPLFYNCWVQENNPKYAFSNTWHTELNWENLAFKVTRHASDGEHFWLHLTSADIGKWP